MSKLDILFKKRYKNLLINITESKRGTLKLMSTSDKEQIIASYTEAYTAKFGKAPTIEAKGGWYSIDGGKNVRLAALADMTSELSSNSQSETEVKTAPTEKSPKAVKKSTAKKVKKAVKSDFSVKAFWAAQISEKNPGTKLPR